MRYIASDELLEKLAASLADGTTPKLIRSYASFDLLIIDGFGFDRIEREKTPRALSLLYKVIDQRNTRRSTALVTNIEFEAWSTYLGDAMLTMALMDRLADSAITLKINGKSYRPIVPARSVLARPGSDPRPGPTAEPTIERNDARDRFRLCPQARLHSRRTCASGVPARAIHELNEVG